MGIPGGLYPNGYHGDRSLADLAQRPLTRSEALLICVVLTMTILLAATGVWRGMEQQRRNDERTQELVRTIHDRVETLSAQRSTEIRKLSEQMNAMQAKIETYFWYPRKRPEATTQP